MMHFLPFKSAGKDLKEKGIDVWLALEAYELVSVRHCSVIVLIAGDGDYVPLVHKLRALGSRVMLLAWNIPNHIGTANDLMNAAAYTIEMAELIDSDAVNTLTNGLFGSASN